MTTFQAIVYAVVHGISEFLPISSSAHRVFIPYLLGWQSPDAALLGALTLGSLLALLVYFRHDWASMISSVLQIIIFRKRPMTLDERLPLFVGVSTVPIVIVSYYFHERVAEIDWNPMLVAGVFAAFGLPLWIFDYMSRKSKAMYDWKWLDAGVVGIVQATAIVPGWDSFAAVLLGALFLNYKRESAAKFGYFAIMPVLLINTIGRLKEVGFGTSMPSSDLSWLSFGVAMLISCLVGLLAIGGFMKHVQQKSLSQYIVYRWVLAAAVCGTYWIKNYHS